jgi:hypothetical protein
MEKGKGEETKTPREEILEFLEKKPRIYKDAVKWTFARWSGISFSSLFDDLNSQAKREDMLRALRKDDCFRIIADPNGGSDTIVQVTEKGRDQIIGVFYSTKEQKELKRLFRKFDGAFASKTPPQTKT